MSTTQPVYGNNGFKAVNSAVGTSVPQLQVQTVKTANLHVLNEVSFFGVEPVGQASSITPIGNTATGTQIATAVNALISVLENAGLTA